MKRFTDTEKWKDAWFSELPPSMKLLWLYLLDTADSAGVVDYSKRLADFDIGETVSIDDLVQLAGEGRIRRLESGKLWLVKFCDFQYPNGINRKYHKHNNICRSIEKNNLPILIATGKLQDSYKVATDSYQEEEEEEDKDKDKDTDSCLDVLADPARESLLAQHAGKNREKADIGSGGSQKPISASDPTSAVTTLGACEPTLNGHYSANEGHARYAGLPASLFPLAEKVDKVNSTWAKTPTEWRENNALQHSLYEKKDSLEALTIEDWKILRWFYLSSESNPDIKVTSNRSHFCNEINSYLSRATTAWKIAGQPKLNKIKGAKK